MYMHEEITKMVYPLVKKYDLELIDLIGELNHAAWELSTMSKAGIERRLAELESDDENA